MDYRADGEENLHVVEGEKRVGALLVDVQQELPILDPTDWDDGDRRQQEIIGEGRRGVALPQEGRQGELGHLARQQGRGQGDVWQEPLLFTELRKGGRKMLARRAVSVGSEAGPALVHYRRVFADPAAEDRKSVV